LLAGSRKQEIKDNLPDMLEAAKPFVGEYQLVLAGAPSIDPAYYQQYIGTDVPVRIIFGQTYRLLAHAKAALVTSGTATLETALFRVPQVVCYYLAMGKVISFLRRHILKVKYISLVNLVANKEVVRELVADTMTVSNVRSELDALLNDETYRNKMLQEYDRMIKILGPAGASRQAALKMIELLSVRKGK
jgi:lipid-A-disaccharide synthase